MSNVTRILTDVWIPQSPTWCAKTSHVSDLDQDPEKVLARFPGASIGRLAPVLDLIKILRSRHKYDVVITGNVKTAQLFALCRSVFKVHSPRQIVLELMLDEARDSILWKLKRRIQSFLFSSVDIVFVSSTAEVGNYSRRLDLQDGRVRFLPFHTNITEPKILGTRGDYILSAGLTGRDYATLAASVEGLEYKVTIVSDALSIQGIDFPANVEIMCDIPYSQYLDVLHNCSIVVVPLKKLVKSTGQVVVLEAMGIGKPVIATQTTGTVDYLDSGVNGILVPVGDHRALRRAIDSLISDPDLYRKLAENALATIRKRHTFDIYVENILLVAEELAASNRR